MVIERCALADEDHKQTKRYYAHTYHKEGVICVAGAFYRLPVNYRLGILLHELGHLAGAEGEDEADILAEEMTGIPIRRINSRFGENLESI